ncbi:MAG: ABC transporter permease [Candidatus Acidiferrales bacterium]
MSSFLQDLRYAYRMLAKTPGFTAVAILTLALGIGANIATFSIVHAILLRALPFRQPEQLVRVFDDLRASNVKNVGMSVPELWDYQDRSGVFQEISVVWPINANLTGGDRPERVETLATSPNYFTLLGVKTELGRVYTQQDAVPGFSEIAVISDGLWRRLYGSDPHILEKKIRLDNDLYAIIGVLPPGFRHPGRTLETDEDIWIAAGYNAAPFPAPAQRSQRMLPGAIGRLKPGLTIAQAQARLETFDANLTQQFPNDYPPAAGWAPRLESVQEDLVGKFRTELFVLFGAVAFVLLIGCVNLANLLLSRSAARQREIAIRLVLGAGRGRLIRQLLTESLLLSIFSGIAALLTVLWLKNWLLTLAPADLPRLSEVSISAGVLLFAFVVSILTGILFGLAPALQAVSPNQVANLREGSRGSGASHRQKAVSRLLVISEIALSLVLLIGAGLLLRSFWSLLEVRPGFNPHKVITAQIWIPVPNDPSTDPYRPVDKRAAFYGEVLRRVSALPGVQEAAIGAGNCLPMARARNSFPFTIQGRPADSERTPVAEFTAVNSTYFHALETPVLSGRVFADRDDSKVQPIVIIDETLARRYWPNQDPLGQQLKPGPVQSQAPWMTVIGVVGNIKSDGFDAPIASHIYFPVTQNPPYSSVIFLRSGGDPVALTEAIRREVQAVDPSLPVFGVRTMDEVITKSLAERRFALELLGVFAVVALLLAAIGIYGVMAYSVSQRTHEIGIRMALGAQPSDILRMTIGGGMILVAFGLVSGLVGSAILTRFLRSMLFSVTPTDPFTYAAIPVLLAAVAMLACYIPARRATRVDPLVALREE